MKTKTKSMKSSSRKQSPKIVIPLIKRNVALWLPILLMVDEKLPIKAGSTNLELSLRLV
jgi:hypothetical protein